MKNQYFGDIGDFGKYGLIRCMIEAFPNIKFGINWYLTENDIKNDGKHIDYLLNSQVLRECDTQLYDFLRDCIINNKRSITEIENSSYLKNTIFYSKMLNYTQKNHKERLVARKNWFKDSIDALHNAKLIYVDPDTGIEVKSQPISGINGNKYISYQEIKKYYDYGFSLIVYNHRDRKPHEEYIKKFKQIHDEIETRLFYLRFSRYSVRDYLFVLHNDIIEDVYTFLCEFVKNSWGECFSLHNVDF